MAHQQKSASGTLRDYKSHYTVDAEAIVDPQALNPHWHASERRRLQLLVRLSGLEAGQRLLDIGCGSGWLADQFRCAGAIVTAMDIGVEGVRGARQRFPQSAAYHVGDLYHLPYADGRFDALVLSEVIEHIEDVPVALGEAARVLRPGGRMMISVPYREHIVEHLCIHCNQLTPANAHLHSFDREALTALCRGAGFDVADVRLLANKLSEMAGFPLFSARWPYAGWRAVDALLNRLLHKPSFMAILALKRP